MRRREFITLLGGAAAVWPLTARAQQPDRVRRIGALMNFEGDPNARTFQQSLEELGWIAGRNVQIEFRWGAGDIERTRSAALELLRLEPDAILVNPVQGLALLQKATLRIPIVFVVVTEPVAQGFVASLAHPGGNITGFSNLEPTVGSKWLELLREIAPGVTRVAVMFNPETNPFAVAYFRSVEIAALKFAVDARLAAVHAPSEIEPAMTMLAREAGGGLIVAPDTFTTANRKMIVELAARYRLPAIYSNRAFADDGGLAAYGADVPDQYRRAAGYIDRILKGEKPADLPVQQPAKFDMVVNLKTAKALGLNVSPSLQMGATEVIE